MPETIVRKLTDLVMNGRQAKVYLAILKNNDSTASELNSLSGVPLNKMYETLKFLNANGFCIKRNGSNKTTYVPTDPTITFKKIILGKKNRLEKTKELQEELLEIYKSAPVPSGFSEYIDVVHGNMNIHKRFVELVKGSKKTILSTSCPPFTLKTKKQIQEQLAVYADYYNRGGKDKTIIEVNEESQAFSFLIIEDYLKNQDSFDAKVTKKSPIKLFIFDEETLMTFDESSIANKGELSASIIKQPNTVKTYIEMYNYLWNQAITVDEWLKEHKSLYERKLVEFDQSK